MTDLISRPLTELCGNCQQEFGNHSHLAESWCPSKLGMFTHDSKFRPMTAREQDVLQSIESAPLVKVNSDFVEGI
jgi:hypothetical protein